MVIITGKFMFFRGNDQFFIHFIPCNIFDAHHNLLNHVTHIDGNAFSIASKANRWSPSGVEVYLEHCTSAPLGDQSRFHRRA